MKVHLIRTPDIDEKTFLEVIDILNSFNGPIKFNSTSFAFDRHTFPALNRSKVLAELGFYESEGRSLNYVEDIPLTWDALFSFCDYYRDLKNIPSQDFIILLTEKPNTANWFSSFQPNRNVFVHTGDWDIITDAAPQYPITYEVVANVLRCLMIDELDIGGPYIHEPAIGCMNDFCMDKKSILWKLKTADLCADCYSKLLADGIEVGYIAQAIEIFEGIRKQFLFHQGLKMAIRPGRITLSHQRKLLFTDLGNMEFKLFPLDRVLYIFYLNHLEGIRLNELVYHKKELLQLYKKVSNLEDGTSLISSIDNLIDPFSNSFNEKKSRINKRVKELLGSALSQYYCISGEPGERFYINLPASLVDTGELRTTSL